MPAEWEQYRDRYGTRPETYDAYVDVWTRLPETHESFSSWAAFSRAANAEPAVVRRQPDRVAAAERLMRDAGYEIAEPTPRGARQWKPGESVAPGRRRIVVFGATGYTGRLVTAELVARGARPIIAGRHGDALAKLADRHDGLEVAIADVAEPATVRALVESGDVLVTTVGPFSVLGEAALDAAIDAGAHYLDSTGEAGFIRHVVGTAGPRAERSGSALLTAFGYDFVPGHIAGALAVEGGGSDTHELQIVYGAVGTAISSGTRASILTMAFDRTHKLEHGHVVERPIGRDASVVDIDGTRHHVTLAGGSEPLTAARTWPGVESVSVWLDLGPAVWLAKAGSFAVPTLMAIPALRDRTRQVGGRTGTGPSAESRARAGSTVVAIARDASGRELARGRVSGPNPYDITASTLSAGAIQLAERGAPRPGALGPLELFDDLDLRELASRVGLQVG
jgi:short subunit dehydrogenase-like uncharacterized protein